MNLDLPGAEGLAAEVRARLGSNRVVDVVVFPSAPYLSPVFKKIRGSAVALGAQDIHWEPSGAFTGAMGGAMAASVGCRWVLVGHSERRTVFGDTDEVVGKKLQAALAHGLSPVLCVGETLDERRGGRTFAVLERQLDVLASHRPAALSSLVIAYEPVWAIGTGVSATPDEAQEVHSWIRARVATVCGSGLADAVRIQYGGSVKPENAAQILACPDIDGALVGGASLQARSFYRIVMAGAAATSLYSGPAQGMGLR